MRTLQDLVGALTPDNWRDRIPLSESVSNSSEAMWDAPSSEDHQSILQAWLIRHQPCIFGRIAAARGLLDYCIITDSDLKRGDAFVKAHIQAARRKWWTRALAGDSHGFIVLISSRRVGYAAPDHNLAALASRLCELYLLKDRIDLDTIYQEQVCLRLPETGPERRVQWDAGVNVFATAGDGRWWNDHRIPGGLGFSVNSVGHMVRSVAFRSGVKELLSDLDPDLQFADHKLDTLVGALGRAMKTIQNASAGPWPPATELVALEGDTESPAGSRPDGLGPEWARWDHRTYKGYYHTDVTVPSLYFDGSVERPDGLAPESLDFTYLFEDSVDNPAHDTMGRGVLIGDAGTHRRRNTKLAKMRGRIIDARDFPVGD